MNWITHKLVLRAAAALLTLSAVSCDRGREQAVWWQLEQQKIAVSHELELANLRYQKASPDFQKELNGLMEVITLHQDALVGLKKRCQELAAETEAFEQQRGELYKSVLMERRQKVNGMKFDRLSLSSGRVFEEVSVVATQDSGVSIRHADGTARLRFSELDASQQNFFGLDEKMASLAQIQEARDAAEYERWVDQRMVAIQQAEKKELAARPKKSPERVHVPSVASANVSPLAQPASRFGSGYRRYWRSSSARPYRYRYVYYSQPECGSRSYTPTCFRAITSGAGCMTPITTPRTRFADTSFSSIP
jgi:hypothetical protein